MTITRKRGHRLPGGLAGAALALVLAAMPARAAQIAISCSALGAELKFCQQGVEAWAKQTGNTVKVVPTPNSATDRLALYQQLLAAGSSDVDVYQIDVTWPSSLGHAFIDLKPYTNGAEKDYFPSLIANNTVGGQLVALPWYIDIGLLYYRKDLLDKYHLSVPQTWADLASDAKKVQDGERAAGSGNFWGFVFQGQAYEGLTCNALEWVDSFGGGTFIDPSGKVTVNNPAAIEALTTAAGWVGTIAPEGVLSDQEEEARGVFQSGNALFMRNWPYAWALANSADSAVKGKVGVAALPVGGSNHTHTGTLGGWQLAVSKYSKHQKEAASLVLYLTSRQEEKRRAVEGSYNPTMPALYKDPDVAKANPFMVALYSIFTNAALRPAKVAGAQYNRASAEIFNTVHRVLAKQEAAPQAVAQLSRTLARIVHVHR